MSCGTQLNQKHGISALLRWNANKVMKSNVEGWNKMFHLITALQLAQEIRECVLLCVFTF
jgi:hypothetical protein